MQEFWEQYWKSRKPINCIVSFVRKYYFSKILANYIRQFCKRKGRILELGCGSCTTLVAISKMNYKTFGVDSSKNASKLAEKNLKKGRFLIGDALSLPFKNNVFDVVYSTGLFEHLDNPKVFIKENLRSLKPNRYAIIIIPRSHFLFKFWVRLTRSNFLQFLFPWYETVNFSDIVHELHQAKIWKKEIENLFRKVGEKVEKIPRCFGLYTSCVIKK